ncbi:unnamed protein product [Spodoptera littoralis]|uniref:Uncharacterized protein n=1 Tax=Spodoptera littoralis TaxID=7109 RepID=A0A9P0HW08_SPOLI|nr:unnamed protein product [Spodoptera littoralis]CAH1636416.1 unnamed protein product [Spodoptera littoralis]
MSILHNIFNFLILFSLFKEISTDDDNIIDVIVNDSAKTVYNNTVVPADVETFSDRDLVKILRNNSQLPENIKNDKHEIKGKEFHTHRKSRDILNGTVTFGIDCYSCYGNDTSRKSTNCFSGVAIPSKKCGDAEHCFVELNPLYIKRGCVLPGRVNRTFICKCPLCNDKPSFDISHYEYKKLNDWEFDNARLQVPTTGMELMCKVCETKGTNPSSDKNCRFGKNADYMVCGRHQLCYTNVDDETDFVSRGCIAQPLYNSVYFFCNNTEYKQELSENDVLNSKVDHLQLSKALKVYSRPDKREREVGMFAQQIRFNSSESEFGDMKRSCIMCNNVATEDCNDPKNKLIPSIMCEHDDDVCYSLHTPFGIVDRGCYNVNHNISTYVCSCNLCNYISISEMPFMFSKKRDWIDNVIELSRTRHFRKSVFKDMSCLRCEVNTTTKTGDMLDSANCLEGSIGNLPVEDCRVDEICAVRALRADGYIWRGCVKAPLYNYWWAVCDRDLCNYDPPVILYDFVNV